MIFNKQNLLNKVKESQQSTVVMDEGLRAYMLKVYNYMASGILFAPSHCTETNSAYF